MADDRKSDDGGGRLRMAVDRRADDFGSRLRDARERRGVSLREIATATKISSRALEALERNDITHLPGGIFSRSFVRAYATAVGLDPETTVEDFVRQFPHDSITAGHPPSTRIDDTDSHESDRRTATVALRLIVISVPVAAVLLYFGLSGSRSRKVSPESAATAAVSSETPGAAAAVDRAGRLSVELLAIRTCAVSARVDNQATLELRLDSGERRTFDVTNELRLDVSDPAAIQLTINGSPARALGPDGTSASVRLTNENYRDYLAAP